MHELSIKSADTTLDINSAVETTRVEVEKIIDEISNSVALLNQVSVGVTESFSGIESEVSMIDSIAQTSLAEADSLKEKFQSINTEVLTQLEAITRLLADTIGEITGVKVENVNVNDDFFKMKIIDVRRPDEFNAELGHIPEPELMCLQDNFEQQIKKINKEEPHLFVCSSSSSSSSSSSGSGGR